MRPYQPIQIRDHKTSQGPKTVTSKEIRIQYQQLSRQLKSQFIDAEKTVKVISLTRISIQKINIYQILEVCKGALTQFSMIENGIDEIDLHSLIRNLGKCYALDNVVIQSNSIQTVKISTMFGKANLQFWSRIRVLDLKDNLIQDKDLEFIGCLKSIQVLILDKNRLQQPKLLLNKKWNCLTKLSLSQNQIQTQTARSIIWHFIEEERPVTLYIQNNKIDQEQLNQQLSFLKQDPSWKLNCKYGQTITKTPMQSSLLRAKQSMNKSKLQIENGVKCIKFGSEIKMRLQEAIPNYYNTYNSLDQIQSLYPQVTPYFCASLLNEPPTKQQQKQSDKIQHQIQQNVKKPTLQKDPNDLILLALKGLIQQNKQNQVIFHEKSNMKTQMTTKILCSYLPNNCALYQYRQQDDKNLNFDSLYNDQVKLEKYKRQFRQNLAKENNIPVDAIRIHKIVKGSIVTVFQVDKKYQDKLKNNKKIVQTHEYFRFFHLSLEDFSAKGNMKYAPKDKNGQIDWRGGWPYYLPVGCERFGLNVSGKYDKGSDRWLQMKGKQGEWAVAFHGVSSPGANFTNKAGQQKKVINSIMDGLHNPNGQMLLGGNRNLHSKQTAVNKDVKIGDGVYCSPHLQVCLASYTGTGVEVNGNKYFLVLQCRVNPEEIKVCSRNDYWVINHPKDIRPYGIILIKSQKQKTTYPSIDQLYAQKKFSWNYYKDKIKSKTDDLTTDTSSVLKTRLRINKTLS